MLFPTRMRRRKATHAFEDALVDIEEHGDAGFFDLLDDMRVTPQAGLQKAHEQALGLELKDQAVAEPATGGRKLSDAYLLDWDEARDREAFDPALAAARCLEALGKCRSVEEAQQLRRRFAAQNHPDRVPLAMKPAAERAMADLNARFDDWIRKMKRGS